MAALAGAVRRPAAQLSAGKRPPAGAARGAGKDAAHHVTGDGPEGGELAAHDGERAVTVIDDAVPARGAGRVAVPTGAARQRAHAGERPQEVGRSDLDAREDGAELPDQIIDLRKFDA